jgi:hypothetical protein
MASKLQTLSKTISDGTQEVDAFLKQNNLPSPSFEPDGPSDLQLSPELQMTAMKVVSAAMEIQGLLSRPQEMMMSHIVS